jgi:hypothetical protein
MVKIVLSHRVHFDADYDETLTQQRVFDILYRNRLETRGGCGLCVKQITDTISRSDDAENRQANEA